MARACIRVFENRRMTKPLACLLFLLATTAGRAAAAEDAAPPVPVACRAQAPTSAFERAVLAEVNRARTAPRSYADTVRALYAGIDAHGLYRRGERRMAVGEGPAAVDEALRFLGEVEPVPPLRMASCLNLAAARHARAKGSVGGSGHLGANGWTPSRCASASTEAPVGCSENIAYGYDDVAEMVAALVVDDGVAGRGHRRNLFDPRMRSFGAGRAPHLLRRIMDVQLFCLQDVEG